MSGWNEETLRKAAAWKAFKEGEALLRDGSVEDAARTEHGWRGTVRSGKQPLRVSVTARSATDLETRCPCPENQSSGALCCHAVAAGLCVLRGNPEISAGTADSPVSAPKDIIFGPNWRDALVRGKLTVSIVPSQRGGLHDADLGLLAELADARVSKEKETHLHLVGPQVASFLKAIAGHPGVTTRGDGRAIEIATGHRLPLAEVVREDDDALLVADADSRPWQKIGNMLLQAGGDFIHLAGHGQIPEPLRNIADSLVSGEMPTRVSLRDLLAGVSSWQDWLDFPDHGWLAELHFVPAKASFHLALDGSLRELRARLTVGYPDADPVPPGEGNVRSLPRLKDGACEVRDEDAETQACRMLREAGFDGQSSSWNLTGENSILSFLAKTLPKLRQSWLVEESPSVQRARERIWVVSPKIDVIGSGDDWLDFRFHYETEDGRILPEDEIRSLIRSGSHHRKLSGDRHLWLDENSAGVFQTIVEDSNLLQYGGHFTANKCAAEVIRNFQNISQNSLDINIQEFLIPRSIQAVLRPYQSHGSAWLADRLQRYGGALLADDMGLGKTLQTIVLIESLLNSEAKGEGPVLVIATTSLLGNWQSEFKRFAPTRRVHVIHGADRDRIRESVGHGDVLITSYGTLARDLAWHLRQHYRLVVADEASLIRNPDTDHARAVAKLRSDFRVALTGTPVENGVRDLWSIFRFIQPGWLGDRAAFRERYELPLTQPDPPPGLLRALGLKTSPFILRRTKQEVAPELPAKLEIDEFCDLSRDQWKVYRELLDEGRRQVEALADSKLTGAARMRVLTTLLRLRQTCCDLALLQNDRLNLLPPANRSAKVERLMILLQEARDGNHRTLVFSQFSKQLQIIEKMIQDAGWSCLRLDGQSRNRQELVNRFQSPGGPDVFLISLKAGGYGLNLTAADTVIHFDPWWNPAAEAQATDRAHRIGQTRPVTVYRLLTRGTVEEKVLRMQSMKRSLAQAIDESGAGEPPGGFLDDARRLKELFEA